MSIKKDETVLASKIAPNVLPIETAVTVTKRDVAITVNSLDIFGEVMK